MPRLFRRKTTPTPEETPMPATTGTQPTTDNATAANRIDELRAEREDLTAQAEADPMRASDDVADWYSRDERRRRRLVEIESSIRDYEQYGLIVETHGEALRSYLGVARAIERRNSRVIERRSYEIAVGHESGSEVTQREVSTWWEALGTFARALPQQDGEHTEQAKIILSKEIERWFRLRDGWLVAVAIEGRRGWVPSPEIGIGGELPSWVRWGAHRLDDRNSPA